MDGEVSKYMGLYVDGGYEDGWDKWMDMLRVLQCKYGG